MVAVFENPSHTLSNLHAQLVMPCCSLQSRRILLFWQAATPRLSRSRMMVASTWAPSSVIWKTGDQFLFTFDLLIDPDNSVENLPVILRASYQSADETVERADRQPDYTGDRSNRQCRGQARYRPARSNFPVDRQPEKSGSTTKMSSWRRL